MNWPRPLVFLLVIAGGMAAADGCAALPGTSVLVQRGEGGRWQARPFTPEGDCLPDFSHCGYGGGGLPLPVVEVREVLEPGSAGDDGARIQAALDRLSARTPDERGQRGALLLRRGRYEVGATLRIRAGGVVLRGEGDDARGTVLVATMRRAEPLLQISGESPVEDRGRQREIADAYVPLGATRFRVRDAGGLRPGQSVWIGRRGNAAWIREIGMDRIAGRPGAEESTRQWTPFDLRFDRVVVKVELDVVTVDAPIGCAIEGRWGGGYVLPFTDVRVAVCGVESLRAESLFDPAVRRRHASEEVAVDEAHATHVVAFGAVVNAWMRQVTSVAFAHGPAQVGRLAKWVTVEDCTALDPVSQITGGRRYPFSVEGQLVLVQRCRSDRARHAFVFGSRVPGPNVFLDCRSEHDYATSEPHHRWSVAGLYDNVEARMAIQDRQWMGSGHGWAGANYVVWNSRGELVCQQPPTAQNFAVGFVGRRIPGAHPRPDGWWESEGTPVEPASLYRAQLAARRGE